MWSHWRAPRRNCCGSVASTIEVDLIGSGLEFSIICRIESSGTNRHRAAAWYRWVCSMSQCKWGRNYRGWKITFSRMLAGTSDTGTGKNNAMSHSPWVLLGWYPSGMVRSWTVAAVWHWCNKCSPSWTTPSCYFCVVGSSCLLWCPAWYYWGFWGCTRLGILVVRCDIK